MPYWARALWGSFVLTWLCAALGCAGGALPGAMAFGAPAENQSRPFGDGPLTLAHLQLKGSHNSYHRAPRFALSRTWRYSHAPLEVQLTTQGVRQIELDVRYDEGELRVSHLPLIDPHSTCRTLHACLTRMKRWSREHPGHLPVFVFIEPKENVAPSQLDGRIDVLDGAIARVFPRDALIVPEQVAGSYPSLASAVRARGFPLVAASRGKFAFVLFGTGRHQRAYTRGRPRLEGRLMFATGQLDEPHTAVLSFDDPRANRGELERAVREGFLVRTRADAELRRDPARREAALASGAHFIGSDFVDPRYDWVEFGTRAPVRCNPVTAPRSCERAGLDEVETALWAGLLPLPARD